jgi:ankyrin repeat protein
MFELLTLPKELIIEVCKCLDSERDINNLAQANTQTHSLLNTFLYRHNARKSAGSALIWAARTGSTTTAQLALQNGADINTMDLLGIGTALILATVHGHLGVVQLLLSQQSIDVNCRDWNGVTALQWAAWSGDTDLLEQLLMDETMEVNAKDLMFGGTALFWAALEGNVDCVELLLNDKGIDANMANDQGWTPLVAAAKHGQVSIVKSLLACNSVDMNRVPLEGGTPLDWAVSSGQVEVVNVLLSSPRVDLLHLILPLDGLFHN